MKTYEIDRETFLKAKAGDVAARNRIIEGNMGLIVLAAERITRNLTRNRDVTKEDRIQDAVLAMPWIIEHYDLDRGITFSTYLLRCLPLKLADIQMEDGIIRVPRAPKMKQATREHKDRIRAMRSLTATRAAMTPDLREPSIHEENAKLLEEVSVQLETLPPRQREVLSLRLQGKKLREVGVRFGVTGERIRQDQVAGILEVQSRLKGLAA